MAYSAIDQIVCELTPTYIPPRRKYKALKARYEEDAQSKLVRIVVETDRGRLMFHGTYQRTRMKAYEDLARLVNSQIVFSYEHDEL